MNVTTNLANLKRFIAVILLISVFPTGVFCQEDFNPIPEAGKAQYHIDFARNFFASPEAEKTERAKLYASLKDLENIKGKIADSAANLLRALQLNDNIQIQFIRHYNYLYLRYAVNTKDETSNAEAAALDAEITKRTAFLNQELIQLAERNFAAFVRQKPELKNYLFAIENIRRYRPFTLSLKEEELLSITSPINSEWQNDLYEKLIPHNWIALPAKNDAGRGSIESVTNRTKNVNDDSERANREAEFKREYAGFASQRDLYAFTLMRLVAAKTQIAKLHRFEDAPSQFYFDRYWTRTEVSNLLEKVAGRADIYNRYRQIKTDYIKKITGYKDVNIWDLSLSSKNIQEPRFTIEQATQIIEKALTPLGTDYGQELGKLLDPTNGRMDIVPGKNRKRGGFSKGFIGSDSVFFSGGFKGFYNDVRVLTHESTHAVHRQLMSRNKILPAYAEGPHYLSEAFAILNEFLLPDYLYDNETDPALKRYYLEQFFEGKGLIMFSAAFQAMLEEQIYDGVVKGSIKEADDLDALTGQIYSKQFSSYLGKVDELKYEWMLTRLMFEDPFYNINYVYGVLLALKFYEMYKRDPQNFVPRYIALLKNGFNASPDTLLKRFLDIDIHNTQLMSDAFNVVEEKISLLENSYQK
ncbi:MAG TPA: M3 family metallopeptidase [Pyrinomonadaceae bacterium]|jgi:oligoendopeptidase F